MAERQSVCTKVYIRADGSESRSAHPDAQTLEFRFTDGTVESTRRGQFPADIELQLDWFGRSEKLGNFYAGAKGDVAKAHEMFVTGVENLAEGTWSERGGGEGERPSMVMEAVVNAKIAAGDWKADEITDEMRATVAEKVKGPDNRKAALRNPAINREYEALRLAAAQLRHKAARDAAKNAGEIDLSAF